jgi:hypothetical protein
MAIKRCSSGKVIYVSLSLAEDALLDAWVRNNYSVGTGPITIYQCEDCGNFHFTSKGAMNDRLKRELDSGQIERSRRAFDYERKFKAR